MKIINQLFPHGYWQLLFAYTLAKYRTNACVAYCRSYSVLNKTCCDFRHVLSHTQLIQIAIFSLIYPYYGLMNPIYPFCPVALVSRIFMLTAIYFSSGQPDPFQQQFFPFQLFQAVLKILTKFIRMKPNNTFCAQSSRCLVRPTGLSVFGFYFCSYQYVGLNHNE